MYLNQFLFQIESSENKNISLETNFNYLSKKLQIFLNLTKIILK